MAMLGEEMQGRRGGMGAAPGAPSGGTGAYSSGMGGAQPPAGDGGTDAGNVVNPVNLLRGIFGR